MMTATLDDVARKKSEPSAEQKAATELVRLAKEQGLSLTGPDGLLKVGPMSAGAVPNAILSESESSSAPNLLSARRRRAIRPSMPSRIPAPTTQASASCQCSTSPCEAETANLTPVNPRHSAIAVIALGIIALKGIRRGPPSSFTG